jgi:hypothetical protein
VAVAVFVWFQMVERPWLADFPPGSRRTLLGIVEGELYVADISGKRGCLVVEAYPVAGGRRREVFRDPTPGYVVETGDGGLNVRLNGDQLYYAFSNPPAERPGRLVSANMAKRSDVGPAAYPAGTRPELLPRLRHARLPGGTPEDCLSEEQVLSVAAGPEYGFWVTPSAPKPGGPAGPPLELWMTPLPGGGMFRVAKLSEVTALSPCSDGVFWFSVHQGRRTLFHARAEDREVQAIRDFPSIVPPVELGDRFYWRQQDPKEGIGPPVWICSSRRDGSDQRRLAQLVARGASPRGFSALFVHEGELYTVISDAAQIGPGKEDVLCRVHPDRSSSLEEVGRVAAHLNTPVFFDDTRCFYLAHAKRDNWLDWSPSGLAGGTWLILKESWLTR